VGIIKRNRSALLARGGRLLLALLLIIAPATAPLSEALAKSRSRSSAPAVAAAIVVDMNTGYILYSQAPDTPRYPASLTKMMTLYVLFGYLRAGKVTVSSDLVVTPHAASQAPTKLGLKPGATIETDDAIKALVTQSANDAAVTIAENLAGTEENFARVMTETARAIGMSGTTFRNASGLPDDEQVTTARDMALLATHLILDYPEYYGVFETRYFTFAGRKYRNHNHLLFGYKGTDGIENGYTRASGFNLTASVHRDNKHLVAVVLGGRTGSQRDAAMRALLDKHFAEASDTKPSVKQLVATLAPPPTPPPPKKPVFALASATPMAAVPTTTTQDTTDEEGDIGEPAEPVEASAPVTEPAAAPTPNTAKEPSRYAGAFHVQVGAFMSEAEAENRLGMVQQRAADLLDGHLPFTASFMKGDAEWYRARFAGFSKEGAQAACAALKKMSLECAVMSSE
jgi:D-alanyl-D-alanine carboxypeptidase